LFGRGGLGKAGHFFCLGGVVWAKRVTFFVWADRGLFPASTLQASPKNRNGGFLGRLRRLRLARGRQGPRPECPAQKITRFAQTGWIFNSTLAPVDNRNKLPQQAHKGNI